MKNQSHTDSQGTFIYWAIATMFFFTGFVSLTYQVAWNKILTQTVGVDHISMTLVVSIFMLGLGLGSQLGAWLTRATKQPIFYFFAAEILIAIFGYYSSPLLRMVPSWTTAMGAANVDSFLPDFIANFSLMLIPCVLMGISLPIVIHQFRHKLPSGTATGFLYGVNLIGAATGSYFAGVFLIGWVGIQKATELASYLNVAAVGIVLACIMLSGKRPADRPEAISKPDQSFGRITPKQVYLISFAVGFVALALEIVYFRLFMLYFRASSYVFPTILTTYLLQVCIGNAWSAQKLRRGQLKESLQAVITWGPASTVLILVAPFIVRPFIGTLDWLLFEPAFGIRPLFSGFIFSFAMMIPVAFLAAFFPLFVAAVTRDEESLGTSVGQVYMVQTMGNFLGSLLSGLILIPMLGPVLYLKVLAVGTLALAVYLFQKLFGDLELRRFLRMRKQMISFTVLLVTSVVVGNSLFYKYFRFNGKRPDKIVEDFEGTALFYNLGSGVRVQLGSEPASSYSRNDKNYLTLWPMDAVQAARKNQPVKKVLIIGLGTGIKANVLKTLYPDAQFVVIELLGTLIDAMKAEGSPTTQSLINSAEVHVSDGRRYINKTLGLEGQFDVIELGVNHITSAGSGGLFTDEFLRLLQTRLSPTGVLAYYAYLPSVKMADRIFRNVVVASPNENGVSEVIVSDDPNFNPTEFVQQFTRYRLELLAEIERRGLQPLFNTKLTGNEFFTVDRNFIREKTATVDGLHDDLVSSEFYLGSTLTWDKDTYDLRTWKRSPGASAIEAVTAKED